MKKFIKISILSLLLIPSFTFTNKKISFAQNNYNYETNISSNKLALVIGNANYYSEPIPNPVKDAEDMTNLLSSESFGFQGF